MSELKIIVHDFLQLAPMYKSICTYLNTTSGDVRVQDVLDGLETPYFLDKTAKVTPPITFYHSSLPIDAQRAQI